MRFTNPADAVSKLVTEMQDVTRKGFAWFGRVFRPQAQGAPNDNLGKTPEYERHVSKKTARPLKEKRG